MHEIPLIPKQSAVEKLPQKKDISVLLQGTETLNTELDTQITERFGSGFVYRLRERAVRFGTRMMTAGNTALDKMAERGIPIPKSKTGMRILAASAGTAGIVIPGLGILIPAAYMLWKRGAKMR